MSFFGTAGPSFGAVVFKGNWNANTNSPALASGTGVQGDMYVISVDGSTTLDGISTWHVGDWVVYNGTAWVKVDNFTYVTSVAGRVGAVVLAEADVTHNASIVPNANQTLDLGSTTNGWQNTYTKTLAVGSQSNLPAATANFSPLVGASSQALVYFNSTSATAVSPGTIQFNRSHGGTLAAPAAVQSGDYLGMIKCGGYTGASYAASAIGSIVVSATENFNSTSIGQQVQFHVVNNGSLTGRNAVVIDQNGDLLVNSGTGLSGKAQAAHVVASTDLTIASLSGVLKASAGVVAGSATTSDLAEGSNLYYTQGRFDSAFGAKSTTNLAEGSNLYFLNDRAINSLLTGYTAYPGSVSSADSVVAAIQKLDGNDGLKAPTDSPVFTTQIIAPVAYGGSASGGDLELSSTSHATKGNVIVDDGSFLSISNNSDYLTAVGSAWEGVPLQLTNSGGDALLPVVATGSAGVSAAANLVLAGGRGTFAAPEYLHDGEPTGVVSFNSSDDAKPDSFSMAQIYGLAAGDQSASNHGAIMNLTVGKINDVGNFNQLQLNGSNGKLISDMALIVNSTVAPTVGPNGIGISAAIASVSAVSTLHLGTAEAVAASAPLVMDSKLKIVINGVEYYLHLTAV